MEPEDDGSAWVPASAVAQLRNWAAVPAKELVLTLRSTPRTVIFRHHDGNAIDGLLAEFPYSIHLDPAHEHVRVGEVNVTDSIREQRINESVSLIAARPTIRAWMKDFTRKLVESADYPGVVVEGRDMTTVVFPDAETRILLTAREDIRIARRAGELSDGGAESIASRDSRDSAVVEFMTAAPGVTVVDSSDINFEQTVDVVVGLATGGTA